MAVQYARPDMIVDLDKVVAERSSGKKKVPRLFVWLLKKITHIDYINSFLGIGYEGVEFCVECIKYLNINLQVEGLENLPQGGRYTFVSNHPLGGIDGVALGAIIGTHYDGHIRYLLNDLLMNVKGLAKLGVPINKLGGQSRELAKLIGDAFASDDQMIIFPAGQCSRKTNGVIQDREWGKACVSFSTRSGRDIVPIHFVAQNSPRFYRIDKICKLLHIKFNLPMLFLPSELVRAKGSTFRVVIGQPIPCSHFDSSKSPAEWAAWLRAKAYEL